ncbi:MAG: type II toxin-antitoxin system RelE/ParE family toxin [Bacteroidetes bacterium]|nr:type II toxin-antitoxin system RelE/ParE family toxin [Bacteroidota bacterium]MBU2584871.1 type II toxin-antitoxin system RelE/ParE family toxin [Bacteroidota bacterium]
MNYEIIIKPSAQKDLDSLQFKEVLSISNRIQKLSVEPRPIGIQKLTDDEGYRIRIGNYRVLFYIDDKNK